MPKTKTWTAADTAAARAWVERKAASPIFRDADTVSLEQVRGATDVELPAVLQEMLTEEGWTALLNALRQRSHKARKREEAAPGDYEPYEVAEWLHELRCDAAVDDERAQRALRLIAEELIPMGKGREALVEMIAAGADFLTAEDREEMLANARRIIAEHAG